MDEPITVEFINTWPSCNGLERTIRKFCELYGDKIIFRSYQMGVNMEYIEKYGFISRGTMIINGEKFIDRLNKASIEREITSALEERGNR